MIKIQKIPDSLIKKFPLKDPCFNDDEHRWDICHIERHWDENSKSKGKKWLNLRYIYMFNYHDYNFNIQFADCKDCWKPNRNNRKPYIEISYDLQKRFDFVDNDAETLKIIRLTRREIFYPTKDIPTEIELSNFKTYKEISDQLIENSIIYMYEKALKENLFDEVISEFKDKIEQLEIEFIDDVTWLNNFNLKKKGLE